MGLSRVPISNCPVWLFLSRARPVHALISFDLALCRADAVSRNGGSSLGVIIADLCNKICQFLTHAPQQTPQGLQ